LGFVLGLFPGCWFADEDGATVVAVEIAGAVEDGEAEVESHPLAVTEAMPIDTTSSNAPAVREELIAFACSRPIEGGYSSHWTTAP
jgi:hypothetical protein